MMTLYVLRERIRNLYQKYELYFEPALKFILGFIVFTLIGKAIGYDTRLTSIPIVLILSLLSAFTPSAVLVLLAAVVSILHIYSVSKILSIMVVLIMAILYLLFVRLTPRLGYVVVAVPILYLCKIPYVIPLLLGLVATPISAIPTACGVFIYYFFKILKEAATLQVGVSLEDTLQLYTYVCKSVVTNQQMFMSIVIFAVVIGLVYFVRKLKIDYAYEIALVSGALVCILCFLICDLKLDISDQILLMIIGTVGSAVIAYIVLFFKQTLDYTGVEHVQFEDDDYIYYVKAVPKINVTTPQKNVKRINAQTVAGMKKEPSQKSYEEDEDTGEFNTPNDFTE